MLKRNLLLCSLFLCFVSLLAIEAKAQEFSFNYNYKFGRVEADTAPTIGSLDFEFPDAARKNGVEGTMIVSMVLGENSKVRDIKVIQTLPFGVEDAVVKGLQSLYFQPARLAGQPVAVPLTLNVIVAAVYDESDKNVSKPKILEKPVPVYPEKYRAEKLKGKVEVRILFFPDGTTKILGVSSTMPREFDKAAVDAAQKITFQPAVHKKSKTNVAQKMTVEFDFKP